MDLLGPTQMFSLGSKKYGFFIADDYSRYTWVYFLTHKHESFKVFEILCKRVQNEKKKVFAFIISGVIMELSLRMLSLNHFIKRMVFSSTSLHQEHLNTTR